MPPSHAAPIPSASIPALVAAFLSNKSKTTIMAYRSDLLDFAEFADAATIEIATKRLLKGGHGAANVFALRYRASLVERGLSPATCNRRLAALRSLVDLARALAIVPWQLTVRNLKSKSYRDTKGPGRGGFIAIFTEASEQQGLKAVRDRAMLLLMYVMALRRGEVVSLDLDHLDLAGSTLAVLGKGYSERDRLSLPAQVKVALEKWVMLRGTKPGPLFLSLDRAAKGSGRLTGNGLYRLVRTLGEAVGVRSRPHGLRHASITAALGVADIRAVRHFSRHANIGTVAIYDDAKNDVGGNIAQSLADGLG